MLRYVVKVFDHDYVGTQAVDTQTVVLRTFDREEAVKEFDQMVKVFGMDSVSCDFN